MKLFQNQKALLGNDIKDIKEKTNELCKKVDPEIGQDIQNLVESLVKYTFDVGIAVQNGPHGNNMFGF